MKSAFPDAQVAYLDSSAIVKLFKEEAETAALRDFLAGSQRLATSELAVVEAIRVARRLVRQETARARALFGRLALGPLNRTVLGLALRLDPTALRSLDAIHLATVLGLRPLPALLVTYDARMAEAAQAAGVPVAAPAQSHR